MNQKYNGSCLETLSLIHGDSVLLLIGLGPEVQSASPPPLAADHSYSVPNGSCELAGFSTTKSGLLKRVGREELFITPVVVKQGVFAGSDPQCQSL